MTPASNERQRPTDWKALALAVLTILTALMNERQQRQEAKLKADARAQWDNLGEYTVPEIERLKERVAWVEGRCGALSSVPPLSVGPAGGKEEK